MMMRQKSLFLFILFVYLLIVGLCTTFILTVLGRDKKGVTRALSFILHIFFSFDIDLHLFIHTKSVWNANNMDE